MAEESDEYVRDFVRESQEHITKLNAALLEIERESEDASAIQESFRTAHTLKGNCAAMGLHEASDLAHALEDLLEGVRADDLVPTADRMDVAFAAVDALESAIDDVAATGELAVRTDLAPTIDELRDVLDGDDDSGPDADGSPDEAERDDGRSRAAPAVEGIEPPTEAELAAVLDPFEPPTGDDVDAFLVRLAIADAGRSDVNNGSLVVDALVDAFDVLGTDPAREAIDRREYDGRFDAVFASAVDDSAIAAALDPVDAVKDFEIVTVTDRLEPDGADASGTTATADESVVDDLGGTVSSAEAREMSVDELLEEFDEFDDLDALVDDVGDADAFDDLGEAGSFADLLGEEDGDDADSSPGPDSEPDEPGSPDGVDAGSVEAGESIDDESDRSTTKDAEPTDDESPDDAGAVFAELKDEVEMVGFDELQDELDDLDFDEFDEEEVGMDELLGDDVDPADPEFLSVGDADEASESPIGADESDTGDVETEADEDDVDEQVDEPAADEEGSPAVEADASSGPEAESDGESEADASTEIGPTPGHEYVSEVSDEPGSVAQNRDAGAPGEVPDGIERDGTPDSDDVPDEAPTPASDESSEVDGDRDEAFAESDDGLEKGSVDSPIGDSESGVEATAADALVEPDDASAVDEPSNEESTNEGRDDTRDEGETDESWADVDAPADPDGETTFDAGDSTFEIEDAPAFTEDADASFDVDDAEYEPTNGEIEFDGEIDEIEYEIDVTDVEYGSEIDVTDVESGVGDIEETLDSVAPEFEHESDDGSGEFEGASNDASGFDDPPSDADGVEVAGERSTGDGAPKADEPTSLVDRLGEMAIPDLDLPDRTDAANAVGSTAADRSQSVRVEQSQIDTLLTLVEGLVTSRVRLRHAVEAGEDHDVIGKELADAEDIIADLQETVMDVRLVPLQTVTNRLPRAVRDVAREQGKEVAFEQSVDDVELDRGILDRIGDPLIHLVRNAVDHGIEPPEERESSDKPREGTVELRAERNRDRVSITVADDGRGLDPDRIKTAAVDADIVGEDDAADLSDEDAFDLAFHPGLSTAEEVTDVSGRGVGMDVVRRTIEDLNGSVSIRSEVGAGTTVTMDLPVTVAIADVLFVERGGEEFGIPVEVVADVVDAEHVVAVEGAEALATAGIGRGTDVGFGSHLAAGSMATADSDAADPADGAALTGDSDSDAHGSAPPVDSDAEGAAMTAGSDADDPDPPADSDADVPVVDLAEALGAAADEAATDGMVIRIREDVRPIALHCDDVRGRQEVVVTPFEGFMGHIPGLSGATVRGRGEVVTIVDVNTL